MKLFIDANIYLDYFRASTEKLASLRVLRRLLIQKKLRLIIPEQTKREYTQNRHNTVEETRTLINQQIKQLTTLSGYPPIVKDWGEMKSVEKKLQNIKGDLRKLIERYDNLTIEEETDADILIKSNFKLGECKAEDKGILDKAYIRYMKGSPPRKTDNSYGDAIIWELLLEDCGEDDLTIISRDRDFMSIQRGQKILNIFLRKEWEDSSTKKISFFNSLGKFINHFEKKAIIKKEVIENEEKQQNDDFINFWAKRTSVVSGIPSSMTTGLTFSPIESLENTASLSIGGFVSLNKAAKFCPLCGKDITKSVEEYNSNAQPYFTYLSFSCPHCNQHFNPNI